MCFLFVALKWARGIPPEVCLQGRSSVLGMPVVCLLS